MKALVLVLVLCSSISFAGCINLESYQLSGRYSQSELDSFNTQKLQMYQKFVASENNAFANYTLKVQRLYQLGYSDSQLTLELIKLEQQKQSLMRKICTNFQNRLARLVRSFK